MELDKINANILQELENNGRISNNDLAQKVGLSPSACLRRVQELERQEIITGYKATINRKIYGIGTILFVTVRLSEHTQKAQKSFEKVMKHAPEVRECHNITGNFEYLLRIEVPSLDSYKEFHTNTLGSIPQVTEIITYVSLESPKDERA